MKAPSSLQQRPCVALVEGLTKPIARLPVDGRAVKANRSEEIGYGVIVISKLVLEALFQFVEPTRKFLVAGEQLSRNYAKTRTT